MLGLKGKHRTLSVVRENIVEEVHLITITQSSLEMAVFLVRVFPEKF